MNKKGFALTETLVVVVFLITIFTFIYVSIIPLIGQYEDMIEHDSDIDVVYKLYHVRKMIKNDENEGNISASGVRKVTCQSSANSVALSNSSFCEKFMEQLNLRKNGVDNFVIIYASVLNSTNLTSINNINTEIASYAEKHQKEISNSYSVLFLLDTENHTIAHLYYDANN